MTETKYAKSINMAQIKQRQEGKYGGDQARSAKRP
jgi:hypothetical protein